MAPKPLRLVRVYADAITAGPTFTGRTDDVDAALRKARELADKWPTVSVTFGYGSEADIYWPEQEA